MNNIEIIIGLLLLFMSRAEHDGKGLEQYIAPVSERFLIPIFFVSLGLRVDLGVVFSWAGLMAFGAAGLLLGLREVLHRRWLPFGGDRRTYLLLCPNLTVVALGTSTLLESQNATGAASWLLLTGLLMTVFGSVALPTAGKGDGASSQVSERNGSEKSPGPEAEKAPPGIERAAATAA